MRQAPNDSVVPVAGLTLLKWSTRLSLQHSGRERTDSHSPCGSTTHLAAYLGGKGRVSTGKTSGSMVAIAGHKLRNRRMYLPLDLNSLTGTESLCCIRRLLLDISAFAWTFQRRNILQIISYTFHSSYNLAIIPSKLQRSSPTQSGHEGSR